MLVKAKLIGLTLSALVAGMASVQAGGIETIENNKDIKDDGKFIEMNVRVLDTEGHVFYTDMVSSEDPILNYDLTNYPTGTYVIQVRRGAVVINETTVSNAQPTYTGMHIQVVNSRGKVVMTQTSENDGLSYNLASLPKGLYTVKVFEGTTLVNEIDLRN